MPEKPPKPKMYRDDVDDEGHYPGLDNHTPIVKSLSQPVVLHEEGHFKITEYHKCNGREHWKEHVTEYRNDRRKTVKTGPTSVCDCSKSKT